MIQQTLVFRHTSTCGLLPTRLRSSSPSVCGHCTWGHHSVWDRVRKYYVLDGDARAVHGVRRLKCSWEDWSDSPEASSDEQKRLHVRGTQTGGEENNIDENADTNAIYTLDELASTLSGRNVIEGGQHIESWNRQTNPEKALLVGAAIKSEQRKNAATGYGILESLDELGRLAEAAGLDVVGCSYQLLDEPNPRTYVGSGKVAEIAQSIKETGAELILFDDELSPGQMRNLEKSLGDSVRLCDRTALILDIFSQRAATREGMLQVQLAQAEYQLPRLTRMWSHLERQAGGASGQVKGMGEKQIEVDRRLLRGEAARLRRQIEEVRNHRRAYRERRADAPIPVVALVGYTNAGKSSLLNALTNAGVLAEDKLFATLDPTTRRVVMPGGQEMLVSDTVGFIQKLPTQLVAAFRATLEEINHASLLLHVVDSSHPYAAAQVDAVNTILEELGVHEIPSLTIWNKVDACANPEAVVDVASRREATVCVSATQGTGIDSLLDAISCQLSKTMVRMHICVPYERGDVVGEIHRTGNVLREEFTDNGTLIEALVPPVLSSRINSMDLKYQM